MKAIFFTFTSMLCALVTAFFVVDMFPVWGVMNVKEEESLYLLLSDYAIILSGKESLNDGLDMEQKKIFSDLLVNINYIADCQPGKSVTVQNATSCYFNGSHIERIEYDGYGKGRK